MAKNSGKTGGTSRIKLIVLDAEVADDQIHTLTQALTNALRGPAPGPTLRRVPAPPQLNGVVEHDQQEEMDFGQGEDEELEEVIAPKKPKSNGVRKAAPTPEVLPIDFNAYDVPLATFVAGYKTESHLQRYLVAAAWYHEHGGVTKVTPAHIYSAYRWLKWPLNVKDFAQPLRDLKAQQLFTLPEKGMYTLHHVGLQRVAELKNGSSGDAA
jgi:hypothetical protein